MTSTKVMRRGALGAALTALVLSVPVHAQTITALKTGEQATGMTKQCYYSAAGQSYTRTISSVEICPLSIDVPSTPPVPNEPAYSGSNSSGSVTAFKTGEQTTGMTKQCYYSALGQKYTLTLSAVALCPLSVPVGR